MLPPAPGLFSTTTDCPSLSAIFGAIERAMRSELPPGGKLTMKRIGFDRQLCALAVNVYSRKSRQAGSVANVEQQGQSVFYTRRAASTARRPSASAWVA